MSWPNRHTVVDMSSKIYNMRVNTKTEQELHQFIISKGGLKKAFTALYNHYKLTQKVDAIVNRLKSEIEFAAPKTVTQIDLRQSKTTTQDNGKAKAMLSNFIK